MLTLHSVAVDPRGVTWSLRLPTGGSGVLRPLVAADEPSLNDFLEGLGPESRGFYDVHDPKSHAAEMCEAIDRYDKLRFVLEGGIDRIQGLFEFSFGLPEGDRDRYLDHGLELRPGADVRFGLCLADSIQGQGVATLLWPRIVDVARAFRCARILLWGGVQTHNHPALRFYRRMGFTDVGRFAGGAGHECLDMMFEC